MAGPAAAGGDPLSPLRELVRALEGDDPPDALELTAALAAVEAAFAAADLETQTLAVGLAARAVELKARRLLPGSAPPAEAGADGDAVGPEEPPEELAARLAGYAAFREAADLLRAYEERRGLRFARPAAPEPTAADPPGVPWQVLVEAFAAVWERARPDARTVRGERVSVLARMDELRRLLRGASGPVAFTALFPGDMRRVDVIVTLLALLELMRLGEAVLEQEGPFGPIHILPGPGQRGAAPARGGDEA
jgi:segregation and condensation protein A